MTSRRSSPLALVQAAQVGEQAGALLAVGPRASSLLMKAISSSPVMPSDLRGPVAPAIGRFDGGRKLLAGELGLGFAL